VAVDFFQCHRTRPDRFTWYDEGDVVRFLTRKLRDGTAPGKSILLLSLSGQLGLGDVPSSIDPGSAVYEITLDSMPPDVGFLRRREDLEAFRVTYRALLALLRAASPGRAELHLLPAAPAPIAMVCGYDLLPKVDPDLVLYDNIKPLGFIERLKVKNHDRI
jgi:hypothetical protein